MSAKWMGVGVVAALVPALAMGQGPARPVVLDLESAAAQAELVLVVRLADVTETKIVHGGRDEQVTEQYRLEPVRVLKGIFAREALLMTGDDLGVYRFAEASDRLERGQMLLVFLGRRDGNLFNCNTAATLAQSIPRLSGADDPLLGGVEALIAMTERRDRAERVALLRDALKAAPTDRAAVPLLLALGRRAVVASQVPGVMAAVLVRLQEAPGASPQREVAARTMGALLGADRAGRIGRREAAGALAKALESAGPDSRTRVAILDALAAVGEGGAEVEGVPGALDSDRGAATTAERAAALRAAAGIGAVGRAGRVEAILAELPLDAPSELEDAAARALLRLRPERAAEVLPARLVRKSEAGLGIADDIARLAELPREGAAGALVAAFGRPLDAAERLAFATAAGRVAAPELVPALGTLLDPGQYPVRQAAVEALKRIGTDEAASALWPHLNEEADLGRKLGLVGFLGRHGFRDGYAPAIEHLSQPMLREAAVEALAGLNDPRTVGELRRIWASSHDPSWNAAAIRGLGRLGQEDIAPRLLEIVRDLSDPLAGPALLALADLGGARAVGPLGRALESRDEALVMAAARGAAKLLGGPGGVPGADGLRDRLAALLADAEASADVRTAALGALEGLDDPRLAGALAKAVRDAALEGTPLGQRIEAAAVRRGVLLGLEE